MEPSGDVEEWLLKLAASGCPEVTMLLRNNDGSRDLDFQICTNGEPRGWGSMSR